MLHFAAGIFTHLNLNSQKICFGVLESMLMIQWIEG